VIEFGDRLGQSILYPVPHRQYVFTIPILLRVYFKYDRRLLDKLCRSAYEYPAGHFGLGLQGEPIFKSINKLLIQINLKRMC
jgi:hypothetical protein